MARKRSPYAAVNERRRKREWNRRSTAQLGRRRAERLADLRASGTTERRGKRLRHGFVNTGYMASLMAERERILAEARADSAQARKDASPRSALVEVGPSHDGRNRAYERSPPTVLKLGTGTVEVPYHPPAIEAEMPEGELGTVGQLDSGRWVAYTSKGPTVFTYKRDAEAAART